MYSIAVIEDDIVAYENLKNKTLRTKEITFKIKIPPIDETTVYKDYVKLLIQHPADIYIVDWELEFSIRTMTPKEIFEALKKSKFNLINKYWIFYSGKGGGDPAAALLNETFPSNVNYELPGKGLLLSEVSKTGTNYFQKSIDKAIEYLDKLKAPEIFDDLQFKTKIVLDNSGEGFYDFEKEMLKDNRMGIVSLYKEGIICLGFFDKQGLLLFIDENKTLKLYYVHLADSFRVIKEKLNLEEDIGFVYNSLFFSKKQLKDELKEFVATKTALLKKKYMSPLNSYDKLDLTIPLKRLKTHSVI